MFAVLTASWVSLLLILSSQPRALIPAFVAQNDLIWHFIIYGVLGFLVARTFIQKGKMTYWKIVCVLVFVTCSAVLDELYQSFAPGRVPSVSDALADFLGALTVLTFIYIIEKKSVVVSSR